MIKLIVAAIILIIIMLVFVYILFKNIIKSINENAKKYFVNKLQSYDYLLEEKQEKLEEIRNEINDLEEHKNILDKKEEIYGQEHVNREEKTAPVKYDLKTPAYRETQFFNNYKEVKKIFTVDNENIIKNFIKEHRNEKEDKEYRALKKIRAKFDNDSIYGCLTLAKDEQIKILEEVLTATEKKTVKFDELKEKENFSIKDLIKYIDTRMEQIEPTVYIYTNGLDKRYDLIDSNIIMKQYNNMSEGIIIKYRNKIYDYSI